MFTLADADPRADLALRREIKYAYRQADIDRVRGVLETNCERLVYAGRVSTVRSIYFDDFRLSSAAANLDGVGRRRKLRLRWYDSLAPGRQVFFEVKWRRHEVGGKQRFGLTCGRDVGELTYDAIRQGLLAALPEGPAELLRLYPEPTVLVEYRREHFAAPTVGSGQLRLTLDYDLRFYDQGGRRRPTTDFGVPAHDLMVLEGKAPPGHERDLGALLHPLRPKATRCSKYVHGCRHLGLAVGAAAAG